MILKLLVILALTGGLAWWLSGYDSKVTGEDKPADLVRRALRSGITLLLVGIGSWSLLNGGVIFFVITLPLAIVWAGCVSELFARGFHTMVDSTDEREWDSAQSARDLDRLARLVREQRYDEAVVASTGLIQSGEASQLAMETMLFRLYGEMLGDVGLAETGQLATGEPRGSDAWNQTEKDLKSILERNPGDLRAVLLLLRLYARDLGRSRQALEVLDQIKEQTRLPPAFYEYAQRAVKEWSGALPPRNLTAEGIESLLAPPNTAPGPASSQLSSGTSIDDLLASGQYATAVELLQHQLAHQPNDFSLWMQLAEAQGYYCGNLSQAHKIVDKIQANPAFDPQQKQLARTRLLEWRTRLRT